MSDKNKNRDKCYHKWTVMREASPNTNKGHGGEIDPAVFQCKKCGLILTAAEAMQLSAYKNQTIATAVLIITTIISFIALIISLK
ncbi:MAG: hypothetical protein PHQ42_04220 [Patescibacteria group bacterium]|nr:hypothetical protein [Patescibacteria group bacterium]